MQKRYDISGEKYGRLLVVRLFDKQNHKNRWECICDCGRTCYVTSSNLKRFNGNVSCGCMKSEVLAKFAEENNLKHGHAKSSKRLISKTYNSWVAMRKRCLNKKASNYYLYGGRGISVCERWIESFENFLEDMGERPISTTLDRKNVNGNYQKDNCRWATAKEQANNRRPRHA